MPNSRGDYVPVAHLHLGFLHVHIICSGLKYKQCLFTVKLFMKQEIISL